MTEEKKLVFYTDRSAASTDQTCGYKYWLSRKEGVRGIVPKLEPFYFKIGRETHEDMHTLALLDSRDLREEALKEMVQAIIAPLTAEDYEDVPKMEILWRRLGWMVAWALYIEPRIRERYNTIQTEMEIILDRDPLWVGVTPDRVLEAKADGHLEYLEYKTALRADKKWLDSWLYKIQLHLGIAAVQEELGKKVEFAQICGLMKGSLNYKTNRLMHPYVWAYYNSSSTEWTHDYAKARSAAWEAAPVWDFKGGIVEWVKRCGYEVASDQFPRSAPVFLNERILNGWVMRRTHRERVIRAVQDECRTNMTARELYFPRNEDACRPPFGDACPYLIACWNATISQDPSRYLDFEPRQPHHEIELAIEDGVK